jgi:hypothetical protein
MIHSLILLAAEALHPTMDNPMPPSNADIASPLCNIRARGGAPADSLQSPAAYAIFRPERAIFALWITILRGAGEQRQVPA